MDLLVIDAVLATEIVLDRDAECLEEVDHSLLLDYGTGPGGVRVPFFISGPFF